MKIIDREFFEKELKSFLDREGRLTRYPAKFRLKITALFYLASKFQPGRRYAEREVNGILQDWHTFEDWAMLRRDLYDRKFLGRESDCSAYWLEATQPTFAAFDLQLP